MGITFGQASGFKERMREKGRGEPILNTELSLDLSASILCFFVVYLLFELLSSLFYENKTLLREYWIRLARLKHEYH